LFSQDITNYWKLTSSFNIYRNQIDAFQGTLLFPFKRPFFIEESSDIAGDFKITNTFILPWKMETQVTGLWYSDKNIPQGTELSRSSIDLGIKKSLWGKRGELSLSATDLFNRFGIRQKVIGQDFTALYQNYYETQIVRIRLNYKF